MSRKGSLDACTVLELKEKAAKRGIKVTGLNKAEIIAKLRGKQTGNGLFSSCTKKKVDCVNSSTGLKYPENTEFPRRDGTVKKYIPPPHYTGKKANGEKPVYGRFHTSFTDAASGYTQYGDFNNYILPSKLERPIDSWY